MNNIDYFVHTQLLIDDVDFPNGDHWEGVLGGGVYAAAGMRIWSDRVGFCCAPGPDYDGNYDEWFIKNNVEISGGRRSKNTTHAVCKYFEDGEREEILLPGCASHSESQPLVSEIPDSYRNCRGMYFFKDCEEEFWKDMRMYLDSVPTVSCWEIFGSSAAPENRDFISEALTHVDLFSLNRTEGKRLTGETEPMKIVDRLIDLGAKNVIFRMSDKGAIAADRKSAYLVPAIKTDVIDVTGGGNSSTGGFVAGFCRYSGDLAKAGLCAGISASYIIRQPSVPPIIDAALMAEAEAKLAEYLPQVEKIR